MKIYKTILWLGVQCPECKEKAWSKHGGDFQYCSCQSIFIDRNRFESKIVRVGGKAAMKQHVKVIKRRVPRIEHFKAIYGKHFDMKKYKQGLK